MNLEVCEKCMGSEIRFELRKFCFKKENCAKVLIYPCRFKGKRNRIRCCCKTIEASSSIYSEKIYRSKKKMGLISLMDKDCRYFVEHNVYDWSKYDKNDET